MLRVTLATNPDSHFSGLGHRQHKRLCCHTRCQGLCTEPAKIETAWANNVCSMRAYGMEPKAQCSRRRRACIGYVVRGANMMIAMPTKATPEPTKSQAVGRMPSTAQSQSMA